MTDFSTKNAGGVMFSQLHGATYADVDGDGLQDFITGKRFWSHLDTFIDPDPHGAPVLYVYRTVRNAKAPGGAEFVPELIHNRSGVGSHLSVVDLNKDGSPEIITSTKRGHVHLLEQLESQAITCDSFAPRPSSLRLHQSPALRRRSQRKTGRRTATTPARSDTRRSSKSTRPTSRISGSCGRTTRRRLCRHLRPAAAAGRRKKAHPIAAPPARGEASPACAARFPHRDSRRPRRSWSTASCTWGRCTTASSRWMLIPERKSGSKTSAIRRRRGALRTGRAPTAFRRSLFLEPAMGRRC